MVEVEKDAIVRCGLLCESNLRWEADALRDGRLLEAAEYAEAAERWALSASNWASSL